MSSGPESHLTEREEKLLMAFFDGQSSFVGRLRCRNLLSARPEAMRFLEDLRRMSAVVKEEAENHPPCRDLWESISRRVNDEQRAELFIGERSKQVVRRRLRWEPITWGAAGAALAASVAVLVIQLQALPKSAADNDFVLLPRNLTIEQQLAPQVAPAGYQSEGRSIARVPRTMEVEYMRSRGRVKMIQHPEERGTILWVTPNRNRIAGGSAAVSSEPLRMLDDHVPTAMTAFDNK